MNYLKEFKKYTIEKEKIREIGLDLTKIYNHEDNLKKVEKFLSENMNNYEFQEK